MKKEMRFDRDPKIGPQRQKENAVTRIKKALCDELVRYKNDHHMSQKDLAYDLCIDEALVSKITRYSFQEFTIDRLVRYLSILHPGMNVKVLL